MHFINYLSCANDNGAEVFFVFVFYSFGWKENVCNIEAPKKIEWMNKSEKKKTLIFEWMRVLYMQNSCYQFARHDNYFDIVFFSLHFILYSARLFASKMYKRRNETILFYLLLGLGKWKAPKRKKKKLRLPFL